jgi:thiamine biosynthesis protein ThiI
MRMTRLVLEKQSLQERWKNVPWTGAVFHYDEIALKRGYRGPFARLLASNLGRVLKTFGMTVKPLGDRIIAEGPCETAWAAAEAGARVCGVAYAAPILRIPRDLSSLKMQAVATYRAVSEPGDTFALRVRRADKKFPLTEMELTRSLGQAVVEATGARVHLGQPAITLEFRIYEDAAFLTGPHLQGPGGLPVGVHPAVLALLSGNIDSPVAAYLMMRRGAPVDFVHFHTFRTAEPVHNSAIPALVRRIVKPQGLSARLFLVPDFPFSLALLGPKVGARLHLILLRRYMVRVASALAQRYGYTALVTGDSLGQVASQTMENIIAVDKAASYPVFRPLIGLNKSEIVTLSKNLGYYDLCILPYKDCCGLVSKQVDLKPDPERIAQAEDALGMERVVSDALAETVCWTIGEDDEIGGGD